tara:strand:+ start:3702 stop:4046 length:345 start_codon:yes stop_codon:yes gene_type:complete
MEKFDMWDARTMGQIFDGCPLMVGIKCSSKDGAEYQGWYFTDGWENIDPNGFAFSHKQSHFWQSKLKDGKDCSRRASPKISDMIIDLIKSDISSVVDHAKLYKQIKTNSQLTSS